METDDPAAEAAFSAIVAAHSAALAAKHGFPDRNPLAGKGDGNRCIQCHHLFFPDGTVSYVLTEAIVQAATVSANHNGPHVSFRCVKTVAFCSITCLSVWLANVCVDLVKGIDAKEGDDDAVSVA